MKGNRASLRSQLSRTVVLLLILYYKCARGWAQQLRSDPPRQRRKFGLSATLFRVLFTRLDKCVENVVWPVGHYDVVTPLQYKYPSFILVEYFRALSLKSLEFPVVEMVQISR